MQQEQIVETLNDLIENSKDGEYGFRICAERAQSAELKRLFAQRSEGCAQAAQQLQALVIRHGGTPDDGGSASGAAHRGWVRLRSALSFDDDRAVLDECERGEDVALARYRAALEQPLPADVDAIVRRQYEGVLRNYEEIRTLRDSLGASASAQ